jgi:hypothetical protein
MRKKDIEGIDLSKIKIPGYNPNEPDLLSTLWRSKIIRLTLILVVIVVVFMAVFPFLNIKP